MNKGINQSLAWVIAFITALTIFLAGAFVIYRTNIKTIAERSAKVDRANSAIEERAKMHDKATKSYHGDKEESFIHESDPAGSHGGRNKETSPAIEGGNKEKDNPVDTQKLEPKGEQDDNRNEKQGREHSQDRSDLGADNPAKWADGTSEKKNSSPIRRGVIRG